MAEKYDKNDLQTQFEGIRDERRLAANTAYRIGNAFLSLLHFASDEMKATIEELLKKFDGQYLSKVNDDQAAGLITFLKGLKVGEKYSFDKDGNIIANLIKAAKSISVGDNFSFNADSRFKFDAAGNIIASSVASGSVTADSVKSGSVTADKLASSNFNEGEQKGFTVAVKDAETGKYRLCIDEIIAWSIATMASLHVKGDSTFDGNLASKDFVSGFVGGKGWAIRNTPSQNVTGQQENKWTGEFDNLIVRGSLKIYEMIISQLLGENDNRIFTGMMEVDHYDPESGKIYLDTQNGKLYNPFRKDDIILVQQYNGMPGSAGDNYITKSYELIISEAGCGSTSDGENRLDWVKFESFSSSMENATPASCIKPKDTLVRVDNLSDPDRKGIMQIITVGTGAPYLDVLYGMKTDPNNALKGRLGNLQGINHPIFGQLSGFGEFLQNLYATGDIILRRTGESIDTKIQMLQNQFATRYAQTSYDVTEENNYLHNGQFLTVTGTDEDLVIDGWTVDENEDTEFWVDANGLPVMVNGSATVSGNHRVSIDNVEGRNVLHIENSGLKQSNSIVRKPGTHKEYDLPSSEVEADKLAKTSEAYKEVQDKLYVTAIVYAKTAGQLTIGFSPCTAVSGKVNELASRTIDVAYSAEWQTIKFEGKWNGTGDFILRYSGDMLISMITITDEPLSNLSKTVSTQILQSAANIKLLGSNIDNVQGTVTKLGIELDAEKKEIRAYVDEQDKALDKSFRSQISITKGKILAEVNEKDNALKTELSSRIDVEAGRIDLINKWQSDTDTRMSGIETDIENVRIYVDEQDKALDKSFRSQISITKGKILAEVNEKDNALKTELSSRIDVEAGRIDLINKWQSDTDTRMSGIETDIENVRIYVDEQDKALDKSLRSQISITKGDILAEVNEKDNALKTELSSRIDVQAGQIALLNKWSSDTDTRISSIETSIDSIKLEVSGVKDTADKTSAALAKLTITVDEINTAVGKAATKDELSAAQETLSSEMDSNDKEVRKYIDGIDSDIRSDYGTTVSLVKQNSDSWSVAAGAFYSDGTLRECGGLSVSTYFTNLFNKKITLDSSGNVKNISKSGLLVTADKTALETKISNVDGKIISSATIETMISDGISKASIRADQISLEGVVTANKYFKINTDGSMQASAGQIAGMKIEGEGLTNKGFDNDAYIILRNDSHKVFAGIGGNVLPASTGTRAVARFTNEESSKFFGDVNYSVVCGAKGAVTNVAIDMTLGGYVAGLRIKNAYMSSGGSTYATAKGIDKNVHSVVLAGAGYYGLPKMEKWDDGYVILVKRATDSGAVHLCAGVSVTVDPITAKDRTATSFLYYDRGSGTTDLEIKSSGDAMMLVYHRDMVFTVTENKKEKKYYGCWIQYKCPRDW